MTKRLLVLLAVATLAIAPSIGGTASSLPKVKDVFRLATVGPKGDPGGEPSITSASDGTLYVSYPARAPVGGDAAKYGAVLFISKDGGKTWVRGPVVDDATGDTTISVDRTGAVYESNLRYVEPQGLQIDVYKSVDRGKTFPQKGVMAATATQPVDDAVYGPSATNSRMLVDRQWVDVYVPAGKTTNDSRVYVTYHDWAAGLMWVNASHDGGKTFDQPVNIITDPVALANSVCNVIPGQIKVVQSGPHAGRVYVTWLSGSAAENVPTGCNYTMLATFGQVWLAYSDDEGATWTNQIVYDSGNFEAGDGLGVISIGHDASSLFADMALDTAGNPYVVFALNEATPPHTGGADDQWNVFVEASFDGGATWNGASDGTGEPYRVTTTGSHTFPAITAGDPGRIAVAYLGTDALVPQLPYGKPVIGGNPDAEWHVYMARSLDLMSGRPTWTTDQVTSKPMHIGDVCTLGIFCISELGSDRSLLDFIDITGDPTGMVHVAYADTEINTEGAIITADQIAGTGILAPKNIKKPKLPVKIPKVPTKVLGSKLAGTGVGEAWLAGVLLVAAAAVLVRRLKRTA